MCVYSLNAYISFCTFKTFVSKICALNITQRETYVDVRQTIPYIASWDRSECKSPCSSGTALGMTSVAAL